MTAPRLLDADLLADFEAGLRAKGIDADALSPGLTDAEIDQIIEPWDLKLPDEVRVWWRWRNGGPPGNSLYLLPRRVMLDLEAAIQPHVQDVKSGRTEYADPKGAVQPVDWSPTVLVQCVSRGNVPAPIYAVHDPAAPAELVRASFGELVLTWLDLIERAVYATRPEGGRSDAQEYPPDVLALGVA